MSVTDIPQNSPSPSLFKITPKISLCIFVIFVIPIVVIYLSEKLILFLLIPILNLLIENDLIKILYFIEMVFPPLNVILLTSITIFYLTQVRNILNKVNFGLRDDWMNYISSKGSKTTFYKVVVFFKPKTSMFTSSYYIESRTLDKVVNSGHKVTLLIAILFICYLFSFLYVSVTGIDFFGVNIWESQTVLNYLDDITAILQSLLPFVVYAGEALLMTLYFVMLLLLFIEILPMFIATCLFPVNDGIVDMSDVPIHFIKEAINQLEIVDFSESSKQIQSEKDKISNFIDYSLEFIKIDKSKPYPNYTNFCYRKCNGLLNEHAINDIRFRLNGLYEEVNKTLIKINHMNKPEDKNEIMNDLEMYLRVITTKDLSEVKAVKFKNKESSLDKTASFFFRNMLPFFK